MNHGYIDVQVAAPKVDYAEDGITVTFTVNEGKRYKLGEIGFKGDLIDSDERLFNVIKTDEYKQDNGYFSLSVIQDDIKALTDFYGNYGYAFAEVNLDTPKHEEDGTIDIFFVPAKKQKVHIRRVVAQGNTRTRDNVIFRELRLADGDEFDGSKLRRSNERLNRLRYFTQADTTIVPTDKEDEVDLRVNLKEDRTGALMGGVGYSTFSQFGVTGSIMERNLFGRGYSLALQGFVSGKSSYLDLSFVNPRIYDTDFGFSDNAYAIWQEWDDFEKKTVGNTIRLFHPIGEYSSVSVGYRLDRYTLFNIPDSASRAYKEYEGRNLSSVLSSSLTFDSTDSRERPTTGTVAASSSNTAAEASAGTTTSSRPSASCRRSIPSSATRTTSSTGAAVSAGSMKTRTSPSRSSTASSSAASTPSAATTPKTLPPSIPSTTTRSAATAWAS